MKKFIYPLLFLSIQISYSQKMSITPLLGKNVSGPVFNTFGAYKPIGGYVVGLASYIKISKRFDFKYELDFETRGHRTFIKLVDTTKSYFSYNNAELRYRTYNLTLPISLRLNIGKKNIGFISLGGVISYSFLNVATTIINKQRNTFDKQFGSDYLRIGGIVSGGLRIPVNEKNKVLIELRTFAYNQLALKSSSSTYPKFKEYSIALIIGYEFGLSRKNTQK